MIINGVPKIREVLRRMAVKKGRCRSLLQEITRDELIAKIGGVHRLDVAHYPYGSLLRSIEHQRPCSVNIDYLHRLATHSDYVFTVPLVRTTSPSPKYSSSR